MGPRIILANDGPVSLIISECHQNPMVWLQSAHLIPGLIIETQKVHVLDWEARGHYDEDGLIGRARLFLLFAHSQFKTCFPASDVESMSPIVGCPPFTCASSTAHCTSSALVSNELGASWRSVECRIQNEKKKKRCAERENVGTGIVYM